MSYALDSATPEAFTSTLIHCSIERAKVFGSEKVKP
jgi:hypothetical protein